MPHSNEIYIKWQTAFKAQQPEATLAYSHLKSEYKGAALMQDSATQILPNTGERAFKRVLSLFC